MDGLRIWERARSASSEIESEVAWWRGRAPTFFWRYTTLPFRLWPVLVVAVLGLALASVPWALAMDPAAKAIIPWMVASAAALLTCATTVLVASFALVQVLHGLIGIEFFSGVRLTAHELGRIVQRSSTLVGRVSVAVVLTAPASMALAESSTSRITMAQPKVVGAIGLGLAVVVLSAALVLWTCLAVWALLATIPRLSRLAIAVGAPTTFTAMMPGLAQSVMRHVLPQWLPGETAGYTAQQLADELVRNTPMPGGLSVALVTAFTLAIYLGLSNRGPQRPCGEVCTRVASCSDPPTAPESPGP